MDRLSAREIEVLKLRAQGYQQREIGDRLFISVKTVDDHLRKCQTKLGLKSRLVLTNWAARKWPGDAEVEYVPNWDI